MSMVPLTLYIKTAKESGRLMVVLRKGCVFSDDKGEDGTIDRRVTDPLIKGTACSLAEGYRIRPDLEVSSVTEPGT